jgi:hypothetical protein
MSVFIFWVTSCALVGRHKSFFDTDDGVSMLLRKLGIYLQMHTTLTTLKTNIDFAASGLSLSYFCKVSVFSRDLKVNLNFILSKMNDKCVKF